MPQLSLDIPHVLGQEEASRRLKKGVAVATAEFQNSLSNFTHEWKDNNLSFAFKALGMAVSGVMTVEHECVRLAASIPLAAVMFKGVIEDRIRTEVGKLLT